jgi:hypothetical protein
VPLFLRRRCGPQVDGNFDAAHVELAQLLLAQDDVPGAMRSEAFRT